MVIQIRKQEPQFNLLQKLTLFLLILAGMNFLSRDRLIGAAACAFFLFCRVKFVVNKDVFILLILSAAWALFAPSDSNAFFTFTKPVAFPLAYCAGLNFLQSRESLKDPEKSLRKAIIVVSVGPFVHFMLNFLHNLNKQVDRSTIDFWSGDALAATGQAAMALMMLVVAITTLFINTNTRTKVLCVVALVAIFIYNLTLAGRTLFVMLLIIFAVNLMFLILMGEKKSKKYKTLLIVTLVVLSLVTLYNINAFGVQDAFESSNLYDRFFGRLSTVDIDEDGRMDRKLIYLENFGRSIWGGVHLRPIYGYAHDILLDTYDEAGIIALLAMILFLISAVIRLFRVLQNRFVEFETKQFILAMYVACLIQFMIEPILQGLPWLFMLFCFIHGMVTGLDKPYRGKR